MAVNIEKISLKIWPTESSIHMTVTRNDIAQKFNFPKQHNSCFDMSKSVNRKGVSVCMQCTRHISIYVQYTARFATYGVHNCNVSVRFHWITWIHWMSRKYMQILNKLRTNWILLEKKNSEQFQQICLISRKLFIYLHRQEKLYKFWNALITSISFLLLSKIPFAMAARSGSNHLSQ